MFKVTSIKVSFGCAVRKFLIASCCGLLAVTALGAPREESELFSMSLDELMQVVVTSTSFFEHDLLLAGSSVSVIEPADWERTNARRTLESIAGEPSVMLMPTFFGRDVIAIRGYAQLASSRGIATVVDGIPMNEPHLGSGQHTVQNLNLGVLNRIEVIRGPGSALYGTDAFHGVLSMSTFESDEDLTRASFEGGAEDYYQTSLQHSVGFGNNARLDFALGISGEEPNRTYMARDLNTLMTRNISPEERYRSQTVSLKMTLNPNPDLKFQAALLVDHYDAFNYTGSFYTASDTFWLSRTLAGQFSVVQTLAENRTLETRIHYMRNSAPREWDQLLFGGPVGVGADVTQERTGAQLIFRQPAERERRTEFAVSFGIERVDFKDGYLEIIPLDPLVSPNRIPATGQGEYRDITHLLLDARTLLWGDQWSVLYGGRVDHYSDLGFHLSPRLGLIFQPVEDTAIKLIYQRAFRAPSIGESYAVAVGGNHTLFDLDPEVIHSYELIYLKQRAHWKAEAVLFYNNWENGILRQADASFPGGFRRANVGKNKAQGVEGSLSWIWNIWRADLGGSYVRSRNLEVNEDFDLFPTFLLSAGVGRSFHHLGVEFYLNNQFFEGMQDVPSNATELGEPEDLSVHWRTDLNITKHFTPGVEVFVKVINVFDRDNRYPSISGFTGGEEGRPLSLSVGLSGVF